MTIDFGKCLWLGLPHYSEYVVSSVPHFRVLRCLCKDRHGGTLAPGMNPATESRPRRDHCEWSSRSVLMPWKRTALRDGGTKRTMRPQVWSKSELMSLPKQIIFVKPLRPALNRFLLVMGFVSLVLTCCICFHHVWSPRTNLHLCLFPAFARTNKTGKTWGEHTIVTLQHDCNTFEIMCKLIDCPISIEKTL